MDNNMTISITQDKIELRIFGNADGDVRDYRAYIMTTAQAHELQSAIAKAVGFILHDNFPAIRIEGVPNVS